jgi:hypothetical protein
MGASLGTGGNGLKLAEMENVAIATVGADPLAGYNQADSTHTCGLYLAQWPTMSEFRNLDVRGVGTGIAVPYLATEAAAGLNADGNRWQGLTIQAVHGFVVGAGNNNVVDGLLVNAWNSAAAGEAPTGLVLDFTGAQSGWTVRNVAVGPRWYDVAPKLTVVASGGAVTGVSVGPEHGLGFEAYGASVPLAFSGSCTAAATALVNTDGSLNSVTVTSGGVGCSGTTTATVNVSGTAFPAKPVNFVEGTGMVFVGGNLLSTSAGQVGGYTVWNASGSRTLGTSVGGGGTLVASATPYPALVVGAGTVAASGYTGSANRFDQLGLPAGGLLDLGLGNSVVQSSASGYGQVGVEAARAASNTVSADFALLNGGVGTAAANTGFTSLNDLFFSAEDLYSPAGESVAAGSLFGKDAAAPVTGSYVKAVGGAWDSSGVWTLRGVSNSLILGSGGAGAFPVGSGTWEIAAKADAATTQELKLVGTTGSASCVFADQTVTLTTSWQVFRIPYNTVTGNSTCDAGTGGHAVAAMGLTPSVSTNVETAWMGFVPAFQELLIANAPTAANQAANKGYVDTQISTAIGTGGGSGSGALPISGGTLTGPLNAPVINGTTNCALAGPVSSCVAGASSALIPPATTGSFTQWAAMPATAQCVYDPTHGGVVTAVVPGQLGLGYTAAPAVTVSSTVGTGLVVTANVTGGQVTSYTIANGGSGYTSCPTISVAAPPVPSSPTPVLDQRRGATTYSADVRVDDFGCAADGVTDDTQCFNNAIQYVTANGTQAGSITLTQGKTYFIGTITGYMQTAWDDGTAPSTDTCGGVPCTNLAPETPGYLGYAIRISSSRSTPLTIYGNGATIVSNFTTASAGLPTYTLSAPFFSIFGSDQAISAWNVFDLTINKAFIGAASKNAAYWRWERVNMNGVGVAALLGSSQYDSFKQMFIQNAESGIIIGGWWGTRAPQTSASGLNFVNGYNLGDATTLDDIEFIGTLWTTQSQSQIAQNALDTWFNTYFFHVAENQTRLTDQDQANLGFVTDSLWRGIYHIMMATYTRYGRAVIGVVVHNVTVKETQNYPIVATSAFNWVIDGLDMEGVGYCDGNSSYGAFGSSGCPSPYDSVNNELPGAVLLYSFQNIYAKGIFGEGGPVMEAVAEPQQVSAAQAKQDFRQQLTNIESLVTSTGVPRTLPVATGRLVLGSSNYSFPLGVTNADSGELCMEGYISFTNDEWCMRAVEQTYTGGNAMPRYLTMENDGVAALTGQTAVQMPGLRVRPGLISSSDATLPVTDFAEQAFSIGAGTVLGQTCATIPGITLPNAVTTDGVLFVKPPAGSSAGSLQFNGAVTAANTLSLTACNPATTAQGYPAGTYYAFLLGGAAATATPGVTGGTVTSTNPLTTSQGDLVVGDASGNPSRLPGNSSTTAGVLVESGTGSAANAPAWQTAPSFYAGNLTGLNAANITTGAVGIGNGGTGATSAVQALANLNGASLSASVSAFAGELTAKQVGGTYQVDQFTGSDIGAQLTACVAGLSSAYGGICDARNYSGTVTMASSVTLSVPNTTVLLPCATISGSSSGGQFIVPAGVRNVTLKGCGLRGASTASGSQGGTVLLYSGSGAAVTVGDPTYAVDTLGFHLDDVVINVTGSTAATTAGVAVYRVQELELASLYLLGNANQTGLLVDGTGNYAGGTFYDLAFNGWQTAVKGIGHQVTNAATTDWMNASEFVRLHIDCPTSGGSPIAGTYGINLVQGDGNSFTGGDVEGCATALHLGANAQNNTIVGLRNENSTSQVTADAGSAYNSWITGGTMFTGALTDNGTRNSFLDTFHRSFNGLNGDWYGSQKDATVTNHLRLGTGQGNERGLLNEYQTDFGYRWTMGLGDGTTGAQFYNVTDLLNNVNRISVGQYLSATANSVTNVILNNGGCYSSSTAPTISFSGGGGTGAAATATMGTNSSLSCPGGYQVSSVAMTANGTGYTTVPSLSFAGSNQTTAPNAVAEITLAGGTNNQTVLNAAGTGAVVLNGSNNAGTGGVVFGSGGAAETTVATVDSAGDAIFNGTMQVGGVTTLKGSPTVKNGADAEIDYTLWAGLTTSQKESLIYKDYTGASQWYMVKDAGNNWNLNSAIDNTDHFKAYQSGETMLNANGTAYVSVNREVGAGTGGFQVYSGGTTPALVAKIDGSGNLTVASCTGCSGSSPWTGITGGGANTVTTAFSTAAPWTFGGTGAASTPALEVNSTPYAGTAANSYGSLDVTWGTAASLTALSTAGEAFTERAPTGFTGNLAHWFVGTAAEFTLGATGSLLVGGSLSSGSSSPLGVNSKSKLTSPTDGLWELSNNAVTGFTRLQFGGTTSSFGSLQTNGTETDSELADGSGAAPLGAAMFVSLGTAPTMAAGAAAGTSPTCTTVTGHNAAGVVTCTTGTAPVASGVLATVTFNGTLGVAPQGCRVMARNAAAAAAATTVYTTAPTTTTWTISVGATALTASTAYSWSYECL